VWVSVIFTMISGFEYVWNCRKYFSELYLPKLF